VGRLRIDRTCGPPARLVAGGDRLVAGRCHVAGRRLARAVGLLFTPDLADGEALWLPGCRSVHTLGMRAPIDVAFVDGDGRVLAVRHALRPGRAAGRRAARAAVEAPAGALAGLAPGTRLSLTPAREPGDLRNVRPSGAREGGETRAGRDLTTHSGRAGRPASAGGE